VLVLRLSTLQWEQRVAAGRARVRRARRTARGTFTSYAADAEGDRLWFDWLYEKPGRAGGFERALMAQRDQFGRFASDGRSAFGDSGERFVGENKP
jgi:hypothetical protein